MYSGDLVIEEDCQLIDAELFTLNYFPGRFCKYDNEKQLVLVGSDESICLLKADKSALWCREAQQINHDIAFNSRSRVSYILDYGLSDVSGELEGYSVLKAYDENGNELFNWSSAELFKELLLSEYKSLLLSNYIPLEVRLDEAQRPLRILINNIQFLEETTLSHLYPEENRYLLLSFANLNHISIFDTAKKAIVQRFKLFQDGTGAFFHTPQFLSNDQVLIFRNIVLSGGNTSKPYVDAEYSDYFSDACVVELKNNGRPIRCWLRERAINAPIMGSAQLIENHLFASYCSEAPKTKGCQLVLLGPNGKTLWSSSLAQQKAGFKFLSEGHIYRAHLVSRESRSSFLKSL